MASGKRSKIKAATVLLRFENLGGQPAGRGRTLAGEIEADFLWECVSDGEFSFLDFAATTTATTPPWSKRRRCCLPPGSAPFTSIAGVKAASRKALPTFSRLLWPVLKKRQQALAIERWVEELKFAACRPEIGALTDGLLYAGPQPARDQGLRGGLRRHRPPPPSCCFAAVPLNRPTTCTTAAFSTSSSQGHGLSCPGGAGPRPTCRRPTCWPSPSTTRTPRRSTTPLSVTRLPGIGTRIGIHIAALAWPSSMVRRSTASPGPGCPPSICRATRSPCCPMPWSAATPLAGGVDCPAVSLYLNVNESLEVVSHESRLEMVHIAANLRHHEIEPLFNAETVVSGCPTSASGRTAPPLALRQRSRGPPANRRPPRASTTTTSPSRATWPIPTPPGGNQRTQARQPSTSWSPN